MNFERDASPSNFYIYNHSFMKPPPPPPPSPLFNRLDILNILFGKMFGSPHPPPTPQLPPHHIQNRLYVPALLVSNPHTSMYMSYTVFFSRTEEKKPHNL